MANRSLPSGAFGQARTNQTNHAKRLQSSVPLHGPAGDKSPLPKVRVVGESAQEAGKAVTAVAATDLFTSAAHGYNVGDRLKFSALTGGAGISAGTNYYIIASGFTVNDFRVSATPFGPTIDITTDLTAGTVTRFRSHQAGAHRAFGTPRDTLPGIQGPRGGGSRVS